MKKTRRVLVCPLDWGLGHATRCIPIINYLLQHGFEVVIAAHGEPLILLQQEFPQLQFISFAGYKIKYTKRWMALNMALSAPRILFGIYREHQQLKNIIAENKIDLVISDNRFGCWNKETPSVFITHQVFIRAPYFQNVINKINHWFLKHYAQCWIPDVGGENNFSGELAHAKKMPSTASYIGLLSRFSESKNQEQNIFEYDMCAIISGPEPQRTLLEEKVIVQLKALKIKAIVVRGILSKEEKKITESMTLINHLGSNQLEDVIKKSKIIVCRSGYSSIMDLARIGKKAILVPTPEQTEQEYLAEYFMRQNICFSQTQADFDLKKAIPESEHYKGFTSVHSSLDLRKQLNELGFDIATT